MGLKKGLFFEIRGYTGWDLWGAVKKGECLVVGGDFFQNVL
jgi:hypothetical protein